MYKEEPLRILARSYKWQSLFNNSKELGGVQLFNNTSDFTRLQLFFMSYLNEIHQLYQDLAMREPSICEEVIKDQIRSEAYFVGKADRKQKEIDNPKSKQGPEPQARISFFTPKKKDK